MGCGQPLSQATVFTAANVTAIGIVCLAPYPIEGCGSAVGETIDPRLLLALLFSESLSLRLHFSGKRTLAV